MPVSPDGILEATFDPVWAAVRLIVDGGMWPAGTRTNRVTNPSFETGTASWAALAATLSNPLTGGWSGVRHLRCTATTAATAFGATGTAYTVVAGEAFAVSAYARGTVGRTVQIRITWTGAAASSNAAVAVASLTAWQRLTYTGVVPAGATAARVDLVVVATGVVIGTVLDVDGVLAERGTSVVGAYFDGATADTVTVDYGWTGTADASTSTAVLRPIDVLTITRSVAGEAEIPVRGLESRPVVGGYYVGSDHEMGLDTSVTYRVDGSSAASTVPGVIASATVTVSTVGAEWGLWLKAPGKPDLTCRVRWCEVGAVSSETIGGVYTIAGGGGAVAQTSAQWSGVQADEVPVLVATTSPTELARLRALLSVARVLLVQTGAPQEIDSGWYYVRGVERTNPGQFPEFEERRFAMRLVRTGVPAGARSGLAGNSWAVLMDSHATWEDVLAGFDTWFNVMKGA